MAKSAPVFFFFCTSVVFVRQWIVFVKKILNYDCPLTVSYIILLDLNYWWSYINKRMRLCIVSATTNIWLLYLVKLNYAKKRYTDFFTNGIK